MEQPDYTRPEVAERTDIVSDITGDTGRLEAFSDGVFAIAITLLVLNLHVPDPHTLQGQSLAGALSQQWPTYAAYLISFAFILIMWVNHHRMFNYIARADHNLLIFNGVLLLFITVVPFPTSLLSEYLGNSHARRADQVTAALVYQGTYVLLALAFNLVWFWAPAAAGSSTAGCIPHSPIPCRSVSAGAPYLTSHASRSPSGVPTPVSCSMPRWPSSGHGPAAPPAPSEG